MFVSKKDAKEISTGIKGFVVDEKGLPVPTAYVYLYRSTSTGLMGPADFMEKTDEKGFFFFDVPEGRYYLVVRKRKSGLDSGPIRQGDRVNIYEKNPINLSAGQTLSVKITLPTKTNIFQKKTPEGDRKIQITLKGKHFKKLYLLVYEGADRKKSPEFIKEVYENEFSINLPSEKTFVLLVRESLKERLEKGEVYGVYGPFIPTELENTITINLDTYK